jgi:hypothetical protein
MQTRIIGKQAQATSMRERVSGYLVRCSYVWSFVRAYALLTRARLVIASGGLKGAERVLLGGGLPSPQSARTPQRTSIARLERAIVDACRWQLKETNCFPRALTAYALLDSIGAGPTLRIGMRARPFAAHAWVEVDGAAVADTLTSAERASLRVMIVIPR